MPPDEATDSTATEQPPAGGQDLGGGESKGSEGQFNWELFPDVPEDQRALLEPHLRNVQGHVTKMEQQYSPYKDLVEAKADPAEVKALPDRPRRG